MSRDFRPYEQYMADKCINQTMGKPLRDCDIKFVAPDGTEVSMINLQAKKEYPEMSFLFNHFRALYEQNTDNPKAHKVFRQLEDTLKTVEREFETEQKEYNVSTQFYKLTDKEMAKQPMLSVVRAWFYGKLVPDFYYSEENDAIFLTYIKARIGK